jgi:hypothetical protein
VVDGQEHRVLRRLASRDLEGHPRADPELARFVRGGRHDGALGRVTATAHDHRETGELRATQDLDGGDELVHVHVQHPVGHAKSVTAAGADVTP